MKKLIVSAFALASFAGTAMAADLYVPAEPALESMRWSGFYLGGHGGCGWLDQTIHRITVEDDEPPETAFVNYGSSADGCFGGGQIGFNYQLDNNLVLGIEGDASWGSLKGSGVVFEGGESDEITYTHKVESFGTVRGRLGYASGNLLPYVTGGWAWAKNDLAVFATDDNLTTSDDKRHSGWTIGAGFEYALDEKWSLKAEYLYLDFGKKTYNGVAFYDEAFPGADLDFHIHTVNVGVNYRF